jgi:hypothetical protein
MSERIIQFGVTNEEYNRIQEKAEADKMSIPMYC